eukprot:TRINITY_DN115_c1_g1_i1.p1 TRINITY_DN115_c1_g1~~TRINITY_DN115_c1_g1_i1.p1  ORF type:complete len:105 (+),score=46.43 TRINITY_DN115_c1_g1_i1:57-371(+)
MDVVQQYVKCMKAKDRDGMLALVAEDAHFKTPRWEVKGKGALRKQMASDDAPDFYGETELVETPEGTFTRTLKAKVALGLVTLKVRQTFTVSDGKVTSMVAKKL